MNIAREIQRIFTILNVVSALAAFVLMLMAKSGWGAFFLLVPFGICSLAVYYSWTGVVWTPSEQFSLQIDPFRYWMFLIVLTVGGWILTIKYSGVAFVAPEPAMSAESRYRSERSIVDLLPIIFLCLAGFVISTQAWKVLDPKYVTKYSSILLIDKSDAYLFCVFSLFARLSKVDGRTCKTEIQAMQEFMRTSLKYSDRKIQLAIRVFRNTTQSDVRFEDIVDTFARIFRKEIAMRINIIEILLWLAVADNSLHPNEETLIRNASVRLGIRQARYAQIRQAILQDDESASYTNDRSSSYREYYSESGSAGSLAKYYSLLNSKTSDSLDEIRRNYRSLMKEYHPDLLMSRGVPPEMIERANRMCASLSEAYEKIVQSRN